MPRHSDHAGYRRRPALLLTGISLAAALGLAACSSSGSSGSSAAGTAAASSSATATSPAGTPTGTLTIATDEPPQTFDPIQSTNSTVDQMNLNDYNTLVQYPSGQTTTLDPQLATSWQISSNGLDYTFNLASEVKFHDGSAFTAADVVFTLDRIKKLDTGVASELGPFDTAKALSASKVELILSKPYAPFLDALSRVYILEASLVSKHLGSDEGQSWLGTNDAGTGPYELTSYVSGSTATFKYFPQYFQGWSGHHVAEVVYKFIVSPSAEQEALNSGQANIAMDIARSSLASFKDKPGYTVNAAKTLEEFYVFMNTQSGPTKNLLVREALSYAYNYSEHISGILGGYGEEASGPLPTGMACHVDITQPTYDLAKAKALLAQAGESHITLTMNYEPETFEQADAFLLLQSDLAQIGVTVKADPSTFPQTMTMLKTPSSTPDLIAIYAFPVTANPNEVLYTDYYSGFDNGNGYNFAQYDNPALDKLLLAAQQTTSQAQQCSLYGQAQRLIESQYVGINVSNPEYVTVLGPGVEGYSYYEMHTQTEDTYDIWVS
jgi:peptide/nickel transport system substrate-binding protein